QAVVAGCGIWLGRPTIMEFPPRNTQLKPGAGEARVTGAGGARVSDMTIMSGAGVVVTGGGGGIGRAIARRLAAGGARVVVNDLDADAAVAVAAEIGGFAVPGDAGTERGVADLIEAAAGHLGEIDVYCSNAGTGAGAG